MCVTDLVLGLFGSHAASSAPSSSKTKSSSNSRSSFVTLLIFSSASARSRRSAWALAGSSQKLGAPARSFS